MADDTLVAQSPQGRSPEEIVAYWTPERKASAIPAPQQRASVPPTQAESASEGQKAHEQQAAELQNFTTQQVLPDQLITNPYRAVGKLYFQNYEMRNGQRVLVNFMGSACIIANSGILTAAHNLYFRERSTYSRDVLFEPASMNFQPSPYYGAWSYFYSAIPRQYLTAANDVEAERYDAAFAILERGGIYNQPVGEAVGLILPYLLYDQTIRDWTTLGYPADVVPIITPDWDGRFMYACRGPSTFMGTHPGCMGKEGDLTGGSSGGPWLIYNSRQHRYVVNGVQSTEMVDLDEQSNYSPQLGQWFHEFYQIVFPSS